MEDDRASAGATKSNGRGIATRLAVTLAAVSLAVAALLAGAVALLPRVLNLEAVKQRAFSEICGRIPGCLEVQRIDLSFRPTPRLTLRGVRIALPPVAAAADSLTATLDWWRLLRGEVRLASVRLDAPAVTVRIPERPPETEGAVTLRRVEEAVSRFLATAEPLLSGIAISVERGTVCLHDGKATRFRLDRLECRGALADGVVTFRGSFTASLAQKAQVRLSLDARRWTGEGRLSVDGLRPDDLLRYFNPAEPLVAAESSWSGEVTAKARGRGNLTTSVDAASPLLRLARGGGALRAEGVRVAGTAELAGSQRRFALRRLSVSAPAMAASGNLAWDSSAETASLDAAASDLDLAELRNAALTLAPDASLVQTLCGIGLGGQAPRLSASSRARSIGGLADALTLRVDFRDARVHIPGADLTAVRASGAVTVSPDTLRGERLACVIGATAGRNGSLRMGLRGSRAPFHLEADLDADLAQVRELLPRWLPKGALRDELEQVTSLSGKASGRLVLGERLDALSPTLEVRSFDLAGRHRRLPFPAELRGSLHLGGNRVAVGGVTGRLGGVSLSGVAAEATWGAEPQLRVTEGRAGLNLEDVYPWLLKSSAARSALKDFGPPSGRLTLDALSLRGPLKDPARWSFELRAGLNGVTVPSVLYPGRLQILRGSVAASEKDLAWSGVQAGLLDSSVVTSGRLNGLRAGPRDLDLNVDGVLGPQTTRWAEQEASLSAPLLARRPVTVSRGHLGWTEASWAFTGDLSLAKGPTLSVDLEKTKDHIAARQIRVKDSWSDARIGVSVGKGLWDVSFGGRLRGETADAWIQEQRVRWTEVEGDFRAHVIPQRPAESSATGALRLTGVNVPLKGRPPLHVDSAALVGMGKTLRIESARVGVGPLSFSVEGQVVAQGGVYEPRLKVSADEVDVKALEKAFAAASGSGPGDRGDAGEAEALKEVRALPIKGSLSVDVGTLRYGHLAWKPIRATWSLSGGTLAGDIQETRLCGIDTTGRVEIDHSGIDATLRSVARDEGVESLLACLWERNGLADGRFRVAADVAVHGNPAQLVRSSEGSISFQAANGRIYRFGLLAKIFAALSVTEVLRGRLPDFQEGVAYRKIDAEGVLRRGVLTFTKGLLDGKSVQVFWEGSVDLAKEDADLTVLVSPFRTADAIISHIPLLNRIMANRLIAVPVRVRGDLGNPSITPMDPGSIGLGILGILERTLKLPYTLIQPLLPSSRTPEASPSP